MFSKILIANRGEIACRVMRTARAMGIKTVAVYSDADVDAVHVAMADEAVRIGPPPSAESYLVIDALLAAIKETGADAVHPGYGFVSENAAFAEALAEAGVAFIGPGPAAIRAMGDKIESKKLADAAGVNTVPGYLGALEDAEAAVKVAEEIGFPVMIKASAGGGGKGMRVAWNAEEAREGFRSAVNEAKSSFGDDRVFIEKFVEEPRHIEIQVLADNHGTTLHLGERECSIQRRHQKVIEEAPSPFLDAETRAAMGAQAVALAAAVDYRSAGTVEFIVDKDRNFYFLEMNTRLQVEHPVTEYVTGLDLVAEMINIAAGKPISITQDQVELTGWAIEARVYAEDPSRNFLPSIGRLTRYQAPPESANVRVDSGVAEGGEISMFYDPMIAKLVTYGADRAAAIDEMADALNRFRIRGVGNNLDFLAATVDHPRFREGRLSTGFIAEEFGDGFTGGQLTADRQRAAHAVVMAFDYAAQARAVTIAGRVSSAPLLPARLEVVLRGPAATVSGQVGAIDGGYEVTIDGHVLTVIGACDPTVRIFTGTVDGAAMALEIERVGLAYEIAHNGVRAQFLALTPAAAAALDKMPVKEAADMSRFLLSPMPGLLTSVAVAVGEPVKAGQELAVIEAMKMENVMRAERDGVVAAIHAAAGDSLAVDQAILEFE
ncbi:MAG: acetyl/propionyl/methylcrotonyl-CoA carboxylase subunit alpha [Pseudomonadota bacterium]|nr:acetyl/propionyl/methylcrotonyl-CoA carboxylase subunit alpha [Pseudomonadota bacterium]